MLIDASDKILSIRQATLEKLLDLVHDSIKKYINSQGPLCEHKSQDCHDCTLGSLIRNVRRCGFWPRRSAREIHVSVETVATRMRSFVLPVYHSEGQCCKVNLQQEVARILQNIPSPTIASERIHMQEQAKKLAGSNLSL